MYKYNRTKGKTYECMKNDKQNKINNKNIDYKLREKLLLFQVNLI